MHVSSSFTTMSASTDQNAIRDRRMFLHHAAKEASYQPQTLAMVYLQAFLDVSNSQYDRLLRHSTNQIHPL
jgi:hypothetical protein